MDYLDKARAPSPGSLDALLYDAYVAGRLSERGGMPGYKEWVVIRHDFWVWRESLLP